MAERIPGARFFKYRRKSTKTEQVNSLESQEREVDELIQRRGISVVGEFQESETAYKPGERHEFDEMMRRLEAGEADGIVCYKLDRMSRNPVDEGRIKWDLQTGVIKQISTCFGDYFSGDHSIPISVEFAQATQYSRDVSSGVLRGLKTKRLHGHYSHRAPVGWVNRKWLDQGERDIVPDPERFPLVEKMIRLVLDNIYTPRQALRIATEEWGLRTRPCKKQGGGPLNSSPFYNLLNNPFIYGMCEENGQLYKGAHVPMLTEDEFWRLQKVLGSKGRPRAHGTTFHPYTGLIRCGECGAMITCDPPKVKKNKGDGRIRIYQYYHCTKRKVGTYCNQGHLEVKQLERQITEFLDSITLSRTLVDWALEQLRREHDEQVGAYEKALKAQQKVVDDARKQVDNLSRALITGRLSELEYDTLKPQYESELVAATAARTRLEQHSDSWIGTVETAFDFCSRAKYAFEQGSDEEKRRILTSIGSDLTLYNKKLIIQPDEIFAAVQKGVETGSWSTMLEDVRTCLLSSSSHMLLPIM